MIIFKNVEFRNTALDVRLEINKVHWGNDGIGWTPRGFDRGHWYVEDFDTASLEILHHGIWKVPSVRLQDEIINILRNTDSFLFLLEDMFRSEAEDIRTEMQIARREARMDA